MGSKWNKRKEGEKGGNSTDTDNREEEEISSVSFLREEVVLFLFLLRQNWMLAASSLEVPILDLNKDRFLRRILDNLMKEKEPVLTLDRFLSKT